MSMVKESVDVDVPLHTAYNQWTRFEDFPRFMEGVEAVTQLDDRRNHWRTSVGGVSREFDTEIVDQLPDERIAWRTVDGEVEQKGVVTFRSIDATHTAVSLAMDFRPEGLVERAGSAMGMVDRRVKGDLRRFKDFVEERGRDEGGRRGRITPG
ncbi:SRPBCC family protein [Kitasatospora purpeofusca]|uniref:SRPBCC family protein n=1 Tax=Kitasatospora purpeofusca TaxID=67352 RepID=UPI0030F098E9